MSKNENDKKNKKDEEVEKEGEVKKVELELEEKLWINGFKDLSANVTILKTALDDATTSTATAEAHIGLYFNKIEEVETKGEANAQDISDLKSDGQLIRKDLGSVKQSLDALYKAFEFLLPLAEVVKQIDIEELTKKTPYALVYQQKIATLERDFEDVKETANDAKTIATRIQWIHIFFIALAFIFGILATSLPPIIATVLP